VSFRATTSNRPGHTAETAGNLLFPSWFALLRRVREAPSKAKKYWMCAQIFVPFDRPRSIITGRPSLTMKVPGTRDSRIIFLIAVFKLFKGFVLLVAGIAALRLLRSDVSDQLEAWADLFRVDPGNRYVHVLFNKVTALDARKLKELSAGTFFYAGLLLTEGTGLLLHKRWAEYFTILATASFLPLEVYEIVARVTVGKVLLLLLNLAVVVYLVVRLCVGRKDQTAG
jgi:uncharacterized membrane protein (DUF2068 family)